MTSERPHHGYRFVRELASGGMGRVDLVVRREGTFARAYALKRPLGAAALDGTVRAMLFEEARVAGLLRSAHVVPVIDVGEDDDGAFIVMELVDGVSLRALIQRMGDRLPLQACVEIARQIAEGLHAAHEAVSAEGTPMDIVHRDLGPANVLVGFDGIVRVIDFGVAKARDRASLSVAGAPKGKRSYMAPEQLRCEEIDRRTDLFALGVVLAEMIRGGPLHGEVPAAEVARRTLEDPPPDLGAEREDVPPELVALGFELLARPIGDRPRDARVVSTRLSAIHDDLRAEEGPVDLGELVRARFDDVRRANREMLADALRDDDPTRIEISLPDVAASTSPTLSAAWDAATEVDTSRALSAYDATPIIPPEASIKWDATTKRARPVPARPTEPPVSRRAMQGAVASVLGLVLAAVALWAFTRPAADTEPEVVSRPPLVAPVTIEPVVEPIAEPLVAEPLVAPPEPEITPAPPDPPPTAARPRRPRDRVRPPREEGEEGIRTWSWD